MADEQDQDYPAGVDNVHASFSMDSPPLEAFPPLPNLSWGDFLQWMIRRRSRHRIEGCSMLPLLQPGDEVLYSPKAYEQCRPQVGEIVIAQHPQRGELLMIKRIGKVDGDRYYLLGDNSAQSTDSRVFGWVRYSQIVGKVQCHFSQG